MIEMPRGRESDRRSERERLVRRYIAGQGVRDPRVLEAMRTVPRERFVPAALSRRAYRDEPLPIGHGQVISQPYLVALMAEAAEVGPDDVVLEIGTGSGYGAAVLARLAKGVYTIDRLQDFVEAARSRFESLGYDNIEVRCGDGTAGWPEAAPFDAIVVTAGSPSEVPTPLVQQLTVGGRLVIPLGASPRVQDVYRLVKRPDGTLEERNLGGAYFVPLIGRWGWEEERT